METIPEEELQLRLESLQMGDLTALENEDHPLTNLMVSFYFKVAGEHSGCEFLHKSFREYLAAEAIIEVLKTYAMRCSAPLPEKSADDYWKDFHSDDPRHWLTRKLGEVFCAQRLSRQVLDHITKLLEWEIERPREANLGAVPHFSSVATESMLLDAWVRARDALADVWDWWSEGVHLRLQPELRQKMWHLDRPPLVAELCKLATRRANYNRRTPPLSIRTATVDAHLGSALFHLCAALHWYVSLKNGWSSALRNTSPRKLWANTRWAREDIR